MCVFKAITLQYSAYRGIACAHILLCLALPADLQASASRLRGHFSRDGRHTEPAPQLLSNGVDLSMEGARRAVAYSVPRFQHCFACLTVRVILRRVRDIPSHLSCMWDRKACANSFFSLTLSSNKMSTAPDSNRHRLRSTAAPILR